MFSGIAKQVASRLRFANIFRRAIGFGWTTDPTAAGAQSTSKSAEQPSDANSASSTRNKNAKPRRRYCPYDPRTGNPANSRSLHKLKDKYRGDIEVRVRVRERQALRKERSSQRALRSAQPLTPTYEFRVLAGDDDHGQEGLQAESGHKKTVADLDEQTRARDLKKKEEFMARLDEERERVGAVMAEREGEEVVKRKAKEREREKALKEREKQQELEQIRHLNQAQIREAEQRRAEARRKKEAAEKRELERQVRRMQEEHEARLQAEREARLEAERQLERERLARVEEQRVRDEEEEEEARRRVWREAEAEATRIYTAQCRAAEELREAQAREERARAQAQQSHRQQHPPPSYAWSNFAQDIPMGEPSIPDILMREASVSNIPMRDPSIPDIPMKDSSIPDILMREPSFPDVSPPHDEPSIHGTSPDEPSIHDTSPSPDEPSDTYPPPPDEPPSPDEYLAPEFIAPTSHEDWIALYEARWKQLRDLAATTGTSTVPLTFSSIPWPVFGILESLDQLNDENVKEFFWAKYPGRLDRDWKLELCRWHPDKMTRLRTRMLPDCVKSVEEGFSRCTTLLNAFREQGLRT